MKRDTPASHTNLITLLTTGGISRMAVVFILLALMWMMIDWAVQVA